jgi:hypothetical protein
MNERIRELAKQAGDYVNEVYTGPVRSKTPGKIWEDGHVDWHTQFNEKFAELIVRECAEVCYDHSNAAGGVDTHFGYGYKDCGDDIKRNFGVEE